MSNKISCLLVVLDENMHPDSVSHVTRAIQMLKGVLTVTENELSVWDTVVAETRVKSEVAEKLLEIVKDLRSNWK